MKRPLSGPVFFTERPVTFQRPVHRSGGPFVAKSGAGRDASHCWTICHVCWRSAGPARGASSSAFGPTCLCHLGLPVIAGSFFAGSLRTGTPADAPSRVYDRGKVGNKSTGRFHHHIVSVNTGHGLHNESVRSTVSSHRSCESTTSVAPSCPKPAAVSPASLRGHERVSARLLRPGDLFSCFVEPGGDLVQSYSCTLVSPDHSDSAKTHTRSLR